MCLIRLSSTLKKGTLTFEFPYLTDSFIDLYHLHMVTILKYVMENMFFPIGLRNGKQFFYKTIFRSKTLKSLYKFYQTAAQDSLC